MEPWVLNYQVYKLNRYGYIKLSISADSNQLATVQNDMKMLENMVSFKNKSSYEYFDESVDKVQEITKKR